MSAKHREIPTPKACVTHFSTPFSAAAPLLAPARRYGALCRFVNSKSLRLVEGIRSEGGCGHAAGIDECALTWNGTAHSEHPVGDRVQGASV